MAGRAMSPRAEAQRDTALRGHVRRHLSGLTPAELVPAQLERLALDIALSAERDIRSHSNDDATALRRMLAKELNLRSDNAKARNRADDARAALRVAEERLRNMAPPLSLQERDPAARARLSPLKNRSRPGSRVGTPGLSRPGSRAGTPGLGDVSVIAAFPAPPDAVPVELPSADLRVRRRYFMRGYDDVDGDFPRHGHYDCVLDRDDQVERPEQYIHDRFKMSFVDTLDSAYKLAEPPPVVRGAASAEDGGGSTLAIDPLTLGRWLASTAPYSRSDTPPLFILCRDVLRHLLKDKLELVSAEIQRLRMDLAASRAETEVERAEPGKVRAMLGKKLRRLETRIESKSRQIRDLQAEKKQALATLKARSDELVDAQADLFMVEILVDEQKKQLLTP